MHLARPGIIPFKSKWEDIYLLPFNCFKKCELKIYLWNKSGQGYVLCFKLICCIPHTNRKVWRYQRGNQKPSIEKDRQCNGQKTNNDLQTITQRTKDWPTRTPLKTGDEHTCSGRLSSSCTSTTHPVTVERDTSYDYGYGVG